MNCPHCGSDVPAGDAFCGNCRQEVEAVSDGKATSTLTAIPGPTPSIDPLRREVRRWRTFGALIVVCMGMFVFWRLLPEDRSIPALVVKLDSDFPATRWLAVHDLQKFGSKARTAVPRLIAMAADDDSFSVRKEAAKTIVCIGSAAIPDLAAALNTTNFPLRMTYAEIEEAKSLEDARQLVAINSLNDICSSLYNNHVKVPEEHISVRKLIRALRERREVRGVAARTLGAIGEPAKEAVPLIIELLNEELRKEESMPPIDRQLTNEEERHLHQIVEALGGFGSAASDAFPRLFDVFFNLDNKYSFWSGDIMTALKEIDPDRSLLIRSILESDSRFSKISAKMNLCIDLLNYHINSKEAPLKVVEFIRTMVNHLRNLPDDESLRREVRKSLSDDFERLIEEDSLIETR